MMCAMLCQNKSNICSKPIVLKIALNYIFESLNSKITQKMKLKMVIYLLNHQERLIWSD